MGENRKYTATPEDFGRLLAQLSESGRRVIGPTLRDDAIVLDEVESVRDFPVGWIEHQDGGHYRLEKTTKPSLFGYVVGPQSWKRFLYPPVRRLLTAIRNQERFDVSYNEPDESKMAFVGVRPCELAALGVLDTVLAGGPYVDSLFKRLREELFIVSVNCTRAGDTCFCASLGTGPRALKGYDIALTEVYVGNDHYLIMESGTTEGQQVLDSLGLHGASADDTARAEEAVDEAARNMGRRLETDNLGAVLSASFDSPHWDDIAKRCLTCGNCTMVCPTCFCVNIEDTTDLTGTEAYRTRRIDSCYSVDFSYIHGGSVRASATSRYRQWMMHKLSYWQEQFGVPGCVGCGRCITWCPVGIDITEESAVFRKRNEGVGQT